MGFTFKEDCPDMRNTKVIDIYRTLERFTEDIVVYDPWVDKLKAKQVYGIDKKTRKLCKLYFRLANYQQPHTFIDCHSTSSCYKIYVDAGCQKAQYKKLTGEMSEADYSQLFANVGEGSMLRVPLIENYRSIIDKSLEHLPSSSILIIENIKRDKEASAYWQELVADPRTGISFDLYYCGLIFLNRDMVKQSYVVNF